MGRLFKLLLTLFAFIVSMLTLFFTFTLYNNLPYLNSIPEPTLEISENIIDYPFNESIKVISYNIHYGMGLNDKRIDSVAKKDFFDRLDQIALVLQKSGADIAFLQEVDIQSSRSYKINQAKYIAYRAGYNYFAVASHWRRKIFPDINGRHGHLEHGLAILSKYPLFNHESQMFNLSKDIPFFFRWLYNPHGVQKVSVKINEKVITLVNIHLEPWACRTREKQMAKVLDWIKNIKEPIIIGGDLNVEPPESLVKSIAHLSDCPWFIKIDRNRLNNEKTILKLSQQGFTSSIPSTEYLKNPKGFYTFPSYGPAVKLDYLFFSPGISTKRSYVFDKASDASDHLPIVAEFSN